MQNLTISPIGYLKSADHLKFAVPHQPQGSIEKQHQIELLPSQNFEAALRDLSGFSHIWLIWWFHRNNSWRPCVMPPRGEAKRRGVFATRSPHRPNPIGISCVPLLEIRGRSLIIGDTDLVDGTPIFDIKPYIPEIDSFPEASCGWLEQVNQQYSAAPSFCLEVSALAQQQLDWLNTNWQIDFFSQAKKILSIDPSPHRTRRIIGLKEGIYRMGCGAWRVFFKVVEKNVYISEIKPGYPERALQDQGLSRIADK
jgi:tRNA-Thr(GGU) m(6)t(6)A37 methyltransferase TsaA